MVSDKIRDFVSEHHHAVLTTFRGSGAAQMSVVSVGLYRDGVAFTTPADRAKLANLQRGTPAARCLCPGTIGGATWSWKDTPK